MGRSTSSLQRVLGFRHTQEDMARARVAAATADAAQLEQILSDIGRQASETATQLTAQEAGPSAAAQFQAAAAYLGHLTAAKASTCERLALAMQVQQQAVATAQAAWQARRTIEILQARRRADELRESDAAAQREIDDLTAAKWQGGSFREQ